MKTVTMVEFRHNAEAVIRKVQQGQRVLLTYRSKPVMRLEPIVDRGVSADDPFYELDQLAVDAGASLSNEEIDGIVYET